MSRQRRTFPLVLIMLLVLASNGASASPSQSIPAADLVALLPSAPSGWTAGAQDSGGGTAGELEASQATREYSDPGGATAVVTFLGSAQMVAASRSAGMMFRNATMVEMMNRNSPDTTYALFDQSGWTGWTVVNGGDAESELTAFNETIVAQVEIDRADADGLAAFIDAIDWEALGALASDDAFP